ncbi:BQ5605_C001g00189 [Microbotryum silenes-dioicae]|uniref:BQ5605_C001g00189 protein n=1 Tax=Microbotryum silenes-dioicae TaxID=796604 RepID=A0A2X0M630_9BASI|nr:BQ5605_C001g00189 [Microbotryum silenes-dioicae]
MLSSSTTDVHDAPSTPAQDGGTLRSMDAVRHALPPLDQDPSRHEHEHVRGHHPSTSTETIPNPWAEIGSTTVSAVKPYLADLDPLQPQSQHPSSSSNAVVPPSTSATSTSSTSTPLAPLAPLARPPPRSSASYGAEIQTLGHYVAPGSKLELMSDDSEEEDDSPTMASSPTRRPFSTSETTSKPSTSADPSLSNAPSTPQGRPAPTPGSSRFFGGMLRSFSGSGSAPGSASGSSPGSVHTSPTSQTHYSKRQEINDEKAALQQRDSDAGHAVRSRSESTTPVPNTTSVSGLSSSSSTTAPPLPLPPHQQQQQHRLAMSKPLASIASVFRSSPSNFRPSSSSGLAPPPPPPSEMSSKKREKAPEAAPTTSLPEPQFDFNKFLEQMRSRSADPIAKYLRSFLKEFSRKPPVATNDQIRVINDFLDFIANKMKGVDPWRKLFVEFEPERADMEFDLAVEAMEKLVMNRVWHLTFTPAIDLSALPGEMSPTGDIERDHVLSQRIRLFAWVKPSHLDLPLPDPEDVSPSVSRTNSPLPPVDLLADDDQQPLTESSTTGGTNSAPTSEDPILSAAEIRERNRQAQAFLDFSRRELCKINSYKAPRDKLICLLNCCKILFGLIRQVSKDQGADSFIPFLIYVVLKSNPEHLVSNIQYIQRFRNPDKLTGEGGYYLSSLNGAISFIEHMDASSLSNMTQAEFERNIERAVLSFPTDRDELPVAQRRSSSTASPMPRSREVSSQPARSPLPPPNPIRLPLPHQSDEPTHQSNIDVESASVLPGPSPTNALESTRNFLVRSSDSVERIVSKPLGAIGRILDQLEQVASSGASGIAGGTAYQHPLPPPPFHHHHQQQQQPQSEFYHTSMPQQAPPQGWLQGPYQNPAGPGAQTLSSPVSRTRSLSPSPSIRSTTNSVRRYPRSRGSSTGAPRGMGPQQGFVDPGLFARSDQTTEEVTREIDRQFEEQRLAALETLRNVFPDVEQEVLEVVLLSHNNDVGKTIDALLEMA